MKPVCHVTKKQSADTPVADDAEIQSWKPTKALKKTVCFLYETNPNFATRNDTTNFVPGMVRFRREGCYVMWRGVV